MNATKVAFTKQQNEAIQFIMALHWTQRRKTTVLPYIVHPIETAGFLGRLYPTKTDLIIAGYLHDVLEDTEATEEAIESRFGARVLELVKGVTNPKDATLNWRQFREKQLVKLNDCLDSDVLRLKAADMLSNATSIAFDYSLEGRACFTKFKSASPEEVSWYYSSAAAIFRAQIHEPIVDFLEEALLIWKQPAR